MKNKIDEYTEAQFIRFMEEIRTANKSAPESVLNELLDTFCQITEHPDGTDLIYYPEEGADNTNEGIVQTIKQWRKANGMPGFKPDN